MDDALEKYASEIFDDKDYLSADDYIETFDLLDIAKHYYSEKTNRTLIYVDHNFSEISDHIFASILSGTFDGIDESQSIRRMFARLDINANYLYKLDDDFYRSVELAQTNYGLGSGDNKTSLKSTYTRKEEITEDFVTARGTLAVSGNYTIEEIRTMLYNDIVDNDLFSENQKLDWFKLVKMKVFVSGNAVN